VAIGSPRVHLSEADDVALADALARVNSMARHFEADAARHG